MNQINILLKENEKKYITIYKQIKKMISGGLLKPNEKLPSKRDFANHLNVSNNTIMAAYDLLLDEGYIISKEKSGYFVSDNKFYSHQVINKEMKEETKKYDYDFTSENIDSSLFPFYTLRKLTQSIMMDHPDIWLSKSNYQGDINLRKEIASYLYENKGMEVNASNIVIVSSLEESFRIIKSILPIHQVGFENPTYMKAYQFFKNENITLFDVDDKGIVLKDKKQLDFIYVTPYNQFPLGIKMSLTRKNQLLNYPVKYIFEDDFDYDLIAENIAMSSLYSLNNEKVIYHGSFSHSICPGIRISYLVLPDSLKEKYNALYSSTSSEKSSLDQSLIYLFLKEGYYYRHIHHIQKSLQEKKELIRNYFNKNHISYQETELSFMLDDIKEYEENIQKNNIKVHYLREYYIGQCDDKIIINYSSIPLLKIEEGLDKIIKK